MGVATAHEIAGDPAAAAVTTWYLLHHRRDTIAFVSDEVGDWPFPDTVPEDLAQCRDVTDETIQALIAAGILRDEGYLWVDESDPTLYRRALRNVWNE